MNELKSWLSTHDRGMNKALEMNRVTDSFAKSYMSLFPKLVLRDDPEFTLLSLKGISSLLITDTPYTLYGQPFQPFTKDAIENAFIPTVSSSPQTEVPPRREIKVTVSLKRPMPVAAAPEAKKIQVVQVVQQSVPAVFVPPLPPGPPPPPAAFVPPLPPGPPPSKPAFVPKREEEEDEGLEIGEDDEVLEDGAGSANPIKKELAKVVEKLFAFEGWSNVAEPTITLFKSWGYPSGNPFAVQLIRGQTKGVPEDYFLRIAEPMDLVTIQTRVENNLYLKLSMFERDLDLITSNALSYFSEPDIMVNIARTFKMGANKRLALARTNLRKLGMVV